MLLRMQEAMQQCAAIERELDALKAQVTAFTSSHHAQVHHQSADKQQETRQLVHALEEVSRVSEQHVQAIQGLQADGAAVRSALQCVEAQLSEVAGVDTHQQSTAQVRACLPHVPEPRVILH
jgi:chromosome segregation ATPase